MLSFIFQRLNKDGGFTLKFDFIDYKQSLLKGNKFFLSYE